MWLKKSDLGIEDIFSKNAEYVESWGPAYTGIEKIKLWFNEWNTRGSVLVWDIKQYFHKENQTIVEWFFKNTMKDGKIESFDGLSLIEWTNDNKICFLKEFGCNLNHYDPYFFLNHLMNQILIVIPAVTLPGMTAFSMLQLRQ